MRRTAAALVLGALLCSACAPESTVPTYRVERRDFELRVTAEGTLEAEESTTVTVPQDVRTMVRLAWIAPEGSLVEEGEVIARFDGTEMREKLTTGRADLEGVSHKVKKTEVEGGAKLAEIDTDYEVAGLELDVARRFQKVDDEVFSRHDIVESRIDEELAVHRRDHAAASREIHEGLSQTELELLGIERRKVQLEIDQAESGLSALEVRAPHAGIFTLTRDWRGEPPQVGSQMWRGQTIGEIPDLETMEAEVFVLEADAGGLEVGKSASVVVEAHPDVAYPARIRRVDAVAKPRFRGSPVQYFGVSLDLEEKDLTVMKPGQRVRATLVLERLEDVLVAPRQAVVQEHGEAGVWVRNGDGFSRRRVELGPSSMGLVVVESGLAEGDALALDPDSVADGGGAEPTAEEGGGEREQP